jgi:hypothetical protein
MYHWNSFLFQIYFFISIILLINAVPLTLQSSSIDALDKLLATMLIKLDILVNKGNNKITELRTIFQRESQNS